jgi:hypothetical protein
MYSHAQNNIFSGYTCIAQCSYFNYSNLSYKLYSFNLIGCLISHWKEFNSGKIQFPAPNHFFMSIKAYHVCVNLIYLLL